MANEIATWYEVKFKSANGEYADATGRDMIESETVIGTGTTLNFAGVEAGEQSIIKCVRLKFSRKIAKLRFWVVNNISGTASSGGVFDDGWGHGYHIRGANEASPLLNANDPTAFNSTYYKDIPSNTGDTKVPFGYIENKDTDTTTSVVNNNTFVYIPRDTGFFTTHPNYTQWGNENTNGNFGTDNENAKPDDPSWYTPYIYLVVNPPLSADGGSRTGWGYRISFLYS